MSTPRVVLTEHSVLDDLSNGGLHMCVMRGIPLGVEVTVAVRLSADPGFAPVLRLGTRGTVSEVSVQSSTTKHGESAGLTKRVSQWSALFIIDPVVRTQLTNAHPKTHRYPQQPFLQHNQKRPYNHKESSHVTAKE